MYTVTGKANTPERFLFLLSILPPKKKFFAFKLDFF